jgi:acetoacetate decarboxylase
MTQVRYGALRSSAAQPRLEAPREIWSQALTAIYETDPEVIAAVLPRPLAGAEPSCGSRSRRSRCQAATFGGLLRGARSEGTEGEYPLLCR